MRKHISIFLGFRIKVWNFPGARASSPAFGREKAGEDARAPDEFSS